MTSPDYLSKGDKVAIVSTARKISDSEIRPCCETLESWGLEVILGENLYREQNQFAGSDQDRAMDMQSMIDDQNIKAIIFARGGYGTVRIIDQLDFSGLMHSSKWLIGFSDATVFHSHLHANYKLATLHAPMAINFVDSESLDELRKALFGEGLSYSFASHANNREGSCTGEIIGGNLSILYSLMATQSQMDTDGKILFLEDLDEYLYHIDRMMQNLKRAGFLKNLSGLIIGGMSEMNDNDIPFGKTAEQIILEHLESLDFPICFAFPAGHMDDNNAILFGINSRLIITEKKVILSSKIQA